MNTIYKQYKERFIEISGRSRSLFLKNIVKKYSYDIGDMLENCSDIDEFFSFLWHQKRHFNIVDEKLVAKHIRQNAKSSIDEVLDLKIKPSKEQIANALSKEVASLKYLKREVEELEKETGRYELFIGYPFIQGSLSPDMPLRAPLLLFPAHIDIEKDEVSISLTPNQPILLNKVFLLAFTKEHDIKSENLIQEFDPLAQDAFANSYDVVDYLNKNGFKIKYTKRKGLSPLEDINDFKSDGLEIKNYAILGRFPLANSIYNDYIMLEKDNLTTNAIDMLLSNKTAKSSFFAKRKKPIISPTYTMNDLDYAQETAIEQINLKDNLVIYGPPGTGKSQTIVNIISDALCKSKRVLVVSQKRAALDVVFSRLGKLNNKAMMIPDPEKDKVTFFERLREMHALTVSTDSRDNQKKYSNFEVNINNELSTLQAISETLFTRSEFGLTLQEMYAASYNIGKDSKDYQFYNKLKRSPMIDKNYNELDYDIKLIQDKSLVKLYLAKLELVKDNPMVEHVLSNIDMHKLKEAHTFLNKIISKNIAPFDASKYQYSRYLTTFHLESATDNRDAIKRVADIVAKVEYPKLAKWVSISMFPLFWWLFPIVKTKYSNLVNDIAIDLNIAKRALEDYEEDYSLLKNVLDREGYALAISGLLNGNLNFLRKLLIALENYVMVRDMNQALSSLSPSVQNILDFSYANCQGDIASFNEVITKIIPVRIYHEIIKNDRAIEFCLAKTVTFDELRGRILALKTEQRELTRTLAVDEFSKLYSDFFHSDSNAKDYLYQIQKQRALWPVRRMIEYFEEYLLKLFPCWLLSPQVVSTLLPLKPDLFDLVVFDEASQIFIESALPTIYRGTRIVVAGDNKQLRPTSGFVKRYLGDDSFDYNMDLSTQAALEVESLLDLATAKYHPVNLAYHYRSRSAELIDFSNAAFYQNKLQIAPNITKTLDNPPIERIKVKGIWQNRHNHEEAVAIVKLVRTIFRDRQFNETIGIVTFNIEQKEYIEDLLDAEGEKVNLFRKQLSAEKERFIDGENASLFVKNLENVQGDERDIIIFSIGYAKNDLDRVVAQFGSLSMEGGENRLNVAITRAKQKIYVVTSIEPEELDRIETTKNSGPKLLKKYLMYARSVSSNKTDEVKRILDSFNIAKRPESPVGAYEEQIKNELEILGYQVDINLGNTDYKISIGVYDSELKKYILGIECDYQAYQSSESVLERDVYRFKFLESRGWKIVRVWSRDWWLSRRKVLENLVKIIEEQRENARLLNN